MHGQTTLGTALTSLKRSTSPRSIMQQLQSQNNCVACLMLQLVLCDRRVSKNDHAAPAPKASTFWCTNGRQSAMHAKAPVRVCLAVLQNLTAGFHNAGLGHLRVEFFLAPFFFLLVFFFVGGWCRLELCHFCKLWQEKTRISAEFRVLQPNTPFGAYGFATQHSF